MSRPLWCLLHSCKRVAADSRRGMSLTSLLLPFNASHHRSRVSRHKNKKPAGPARRASGASRAPLCTLSKRRYAKRLHATKRRGPVQEAKEAVKNEQACHGITFKDVGEIRIRGPGLSIKQREAVDLKKKDTRR